MYRKHFALTHHPFGPEIAPEDLFPSTTSRELDIRLAHLLDLRGIGLITGDSGSGKTCACRRALMHCTRGCTASSNPRSRLTDSLKDREQPSVD